VPQHDEVWVAEDDGRIVGFFMLSDNFLYHLSRAPRSGRGQPAPRPGEGARSGRFSPVGVPAQHAGAHVL
jgi:hypothetical protein